MKNLLYNLENHLQHHNVARQLYISQKPPQKTYHQAPIRQNSPDLGKAQINFDFSLGLHNFGYAEGRLRLGFAQINLANLSACTTFADNKKPMKHLLLIMLTACCSLNAAPAERIFFVSRNLNKNIIVYDVNLDNGNLNTRKPLHPYWYRLEENPITTGELTFIQNRLAYGYTVEEERNNEAIVKLKAYKKRLLRICKRGGKWVGITTINNKECILTEIYAHCPSRTSCDYLILKGKSLKDGKHEEETVK